MLALRLQLICRTETSSRAGRWQMSARSRVGDLLYFIPRTYRQENAQLACCLVFRSHRYGQTGSLPRLFFHTESDTTAYYLQRSSGQDESGNAPARLTSLKIPHSQATSKAKVQPWGQDGLSARIACLMAVSRWQRGTLVAGRSASTALFNATHRSIIRAQRYGWPPDVETMSAGSTASFSLTSGAAAAATKFSADHVLPTVAGRKPTGVMRWASEATMNSGPQGPHPDITSRSCVAFLFMFRLRCITRASLASRRNTTQLRATSCTGFGSDRCVRACCCAAFR